MRTRGDQYQGNLEVGQRVHCILYGGRDGVISTINGQQDPGSIKSLGGGCVVMGGRATVDVVFPEYISRAIPESIIRGVQWFIEDKIESQEVIELCKGIATKAVEKEKQSDKERAEARAKTKAELPAKYPYLIPMNEQSKYKGHSHGAKNLRTELKRVFPSVKFSVRSESYSGGDNINIGWTDGPLTEDVKKVSDKYQEGSFDGMEDFYNYDHENVWPDVFGGARYVFENRHESADLILKVAKAMSFDLPTGEYDNSGCLYGLDWEGSQRIYREARQTRT